MHLAWNCAIEIYADIDIDIDCDFSTYCKSLLRPLFSYIPS